ncbi:hypothetical protein Cgig2_014223 [Carnegiea gigantea]|uniref:Uncharacterized protein n=1 Tax=Carnegiea gigantea TaxID=171969 RepID=A0A9Q1K0T6_9CARY|nr:hypothetical protein Cgig2_014223 [Carnegiea gigantea]
MVQRKIPLSAPPSSSVALRPPARPGFGKIGIPSVVRANHFLVQLADRDLHHYDVCVTPEVASKKVCREIVAKLVEVYRQSHLGNRIPAYDGKKSLYTAGALPFTSKEFVIELPTESAGSSRSEKRKFKVTVKLAAKVDVHQLQEYVCGRVSESPQEAIQSLDVVLRAAKPLNEYVIIGRSFFSPSLGHGPLGEGLEYWRGYYQSIRPTQMGLSLNIDASARPFYEPVMLTEFIAKYLNLRELSKPLSDAARVKVKKALKGITIETNHRGYRKCFKVTGMSTEPSNQLMFPLGDDHNLQMSVSQFFREKYQMPLRYPFLPCIQTGQSKRPMYLPMEVCKIVSGQKYLKKLNERQVLELLRATCQRPGEREDNIKKMIKDNRYPQNPMVRREFGMEVSEACATVNARVLPPPMLTYQDTVAPGMGQWNMINKKMYEGAAVSCWACINFSSMDQGLVNQFCRDLVAMCISKGMKFNEKPCIPIRSAHPAQIEKALSDIHSQVGKQRQSLQLLIIMLPDASGSYALFHANSDFFVYAAKIKKVCDTELGIVSQCCQPKKASKLSPQYLENVALKINVKHFRICSAIKMVAYWHSHLKAGGRNTVLSDALRRNIPLLTDRPTIIFGADVTHAAPGEDTSASIAAVVASMDWPEVTKYKGLVSAQGHREEIIQDLYKIVDDPKKGRVHGGMIRELLIGFRRSTGQRPERIIFFRDGVSEGQFSQVLLEEMDAIRRACASLESGYLPRVTFVVVQKRHHTRLFPVNRDSADNSGNILPGSILSSSACI